MTDEDDRRHEQRRRWRRIRRRVAVVVLVLAAWLVIVGALFIRARADATSGLASASAAEKLTTPDDIIHGRALSSLGESQRAFASARHRLANPLLLPVRILPVAGRQLRAARALVAAAAEVSRTGAVLVREGRDALGQPRQTGAERIALLRRVADVAGSAQQRLDHLDLGPSRALLGPLASRRAEMVTKLGRVRRSLAVGSVTARGLADVLGGPRTYLVLAGNNGEMRAGSGMFLSAGELRLSGGAMALSDFRPTGDLFIPAGHAAPAIADADYAARWGWLNPNREWRNLAASPRFDATAQLAAQMWQASGGSPPDGVLALDPIALSAILRATGPVVAGGRTVGADDVVPFLLHDQYAGITTLEASAQAARRDQLSAIARASVAALQGGHWDPGVLASSLGEAVRGRHLMAWAASGADAGAWKAAGLTGTMSPDSVAVSVLNRGGNKLDQFLSVESRLEVATGPSSTDVTLRVTLTDAVPAGESIYIAGPYPGSGATAAGQYIGVLSVDVPGDVTRFRSDGPPEVANGSDGPSHVAAVPVRIDPGGSVTVTFTFHREGSHGSLRVEPSARIPATRWTAPGDSWLGTAAHRVSW